MNDNSIDVQRNQRITRREEARELTPEERLSPIDLEGVNFEEAVDRILAINEIREEIGDEHLDEYRQALMEDVRLGSRKILDLVRWYNDQHPCAPIAIPSDANTVAAWLRRPERQVIWDIEQLMAQGTTLIIAGNVGIGKSWETMHLAFQFKLGGTWHGLRCRQLTPIYLCLELTENQMQRRIRKLAGIYPDVTDINFLALKGGDYRLNTELGRSNLLNLLHGYRQSFSIIILDPLALFVDGKLEKVDWNGEIEPVLTQIKHDFGCSIIFNHNFRKKIQIYGHSEDMFAPDRLKGVSDLIDRADNIVVFVSESQPRRDAEGGSQRIEIAKWMHAAKTRDAESELRPHRVRWDYGQAMLVPEGEQGWVMQ
jgi:hypothetical protein